MSVLTWSKTHAIVLLSMLCAYCPHSPPYSSLASCKYVLIWGQTHAIVLIGIQCAYCPHSPPYSSLASCKYVLTWGQTHAIVLIGIQCAYCPHSSRVCYGPHKCGVSLMSSQAMCVLLFVLWVSQKYEITTVLIKVLIHISQMSSRSTSS